MKLRENVPVRRKSPKIYADYHAYKESLKEDFHGRCGYCDDHERFTEVPFQIDHFVPKAIMKNITENDYNNLVYSCRRCNRSKWDKWPSGDEKIHHNDKEGFIDPCDELYDQQFERNSRGEIIPVTELGRWMWEELNLDNAAHRIIWTLTQIRKTLEEVKQLPGATDDARIVALCNEYFKLEDQLRGIPHF